MPKQPAFLEELISIFNRSTLAYRNYLNAGKTFQFAGELKFHNSQALKLLTENRSLAAGNLQNDIQALITHYTEWTKKWEKLAAEKEHQPADVFVFDNDVTFPGQAAQNLEDAYRSSEEYPA